MDTRIMRVLLVILQYNFERIFVYECIILLCNDQYLSIVIIMSSLTRIVRSLTMMTGFFIF
jgi:hypothetical protein